MTKPLTKKQIREYVKTGASKCPYCGASYIVGDSFDPEDASSAVRKVECEDCGKSWQEVYKVVDIIEE